MRHLPARSPPPRNGRMASRTSWCVCRKGFKIPSNGPDFIPEEIVNRRSPKIATSSGSRSFLMPFRAVHHSHVYVDLPEGTDTEGLGLGMGSNFGNSMDLIEYGTGNDADIFPTDNEDHQEGIAVPVRVSLPPVRGADFDRQRVGIKFYPKGTVPKYVVTSHQMRTGVGNDWVLNRERIEDLLLRAGHKLSIDEPAMPTGALIADNWLQAAALLSIPPNTIARHERFWPLPKPALVISFQPHMHFRGSRMMLEAIHPDGRREVLTDATHYDQNWQMTYKYKTPHLFPAGTILHTVSFHDNTANNKHNPDPTSWIGWGRRTMDEMGHGWTDIAFLTDEQYRQELAKRRAPADATASR